jgi:hypothetical protein
MNGLLSFLHFSARVRVFTWLGCSWALVSHSDSGVVVRVSPLRDLGRRTGKRDREAEGAVNVRGRCWFPDEIVRPGGVLSGAGGGIVG